MPTPDEKIEQPEIVDCAAPVAMIDAILDTLEDIWEQLGSLAAEAITAGKDPDYMKTSYLYGIISGLLMTADAAEKMVQLDKNWSSYPYTVNVLLDLEHSIDTLGQPGMHWEHWKEYREAANSEFLEQLRALDPEEEQRQ